LRERLLLQHEVVELDPEVLVDELGFLENVQSQELCHLLLRERLLLQHEVFELDPEVLVDELGFLENGQKLVVGECRLNPKLLAQSVCLITVIAARHLVVGVELHSVGPEDVHCELDAVDYADVFGVDLGFSKPGVE